MDDPNSKDLPLMANTNDIMVHHYIFELSCNFVEKYFEGSVIIHLKPELKSNLSDINKKQGDSAETKVDKDFVCILDCCDLTVNSVWEIDIGEDEFSNSKFRACKKDYLLKEKLKFTMDQWSLRIWKPGVSSSCCFPQFLRIFYCTKAEGQSLTWVKDQDGQLAVYTYGAWINNRSLFPCQEPPMAMATWEALVTVVPTAIVLMSGDNRPQLLLQEDGSTCYYYYTKMRLPLSTLALAVGFWKIESHFDCKSENVLVDIRVCAAPSLLPLVVKEIATYIYNCVESAECIFGQYPFPRIDFLIVPRGFGSLGMASPNVIFISQSVIAGDGSMCCRIAHEVAHAWFGLLIGASDWTEEWLSEGFATFCEDRIHTKAIRLQYSDEIDYWELKTFLRAKTLIAEMENTEDELHILRPNKGETVIQNVNNVEAVVLKNGRNPEKSFMQVHYIKGYFLLKSLNDIIGDDSFLEFLRMYVQKYKGMLVDSMEMLQLFVSTFPEKCGEQHITVEKIASEWLHTADVPACITSIRVPSSNRAYSLASLELKKWKGLVKKNHGRKSTKRKRYSTDHFLELDVDSLLILLDLLVEESVLPSTVLKHMGKAYDLEHRNAEIRHRWCELIVKHRYYDGYHSLERFLTDDLAMGVYLYGELILNGTKSQKHFAESCFNSVRDEIEPNIVSVVQRMLDMTE